MTKQELIQNDYIYIMTINNGVEIWGKLINNTPNNELLHYYYYYPAILETLGEPEIICGQMLKIAKKLSETFNIPC